MYLGKFKRYLIPVLRLAQQSPNALQEAPDSVWPHFIDAADGKPHTALAIEVERNQFDHAEEALCALIAQYAAQIVNEITHVGENEGVRGAEIDRLLAKFNIPVLMEESAENRNKVLWQRLLAEIRVG